MILTMQNDGSWTAFQRINERSYVAEGTTREDARDALIKILREKNLLYKNILFNGGGNEHERTD
jgi:hypothetical protein